ncbi:unnamed protein product [Camellia sinensis]
MADNFLSCPRSLASHDHPSDVPKSITTRMFITVSMNRILCPNSSCNEDASHVKLASSLNNISFVTLNTDILSAYFWNLRFVDKYTVSTQGTKVKMLNYNETIEIIFQGTNVLDISETHPMHLHGYNFYVVGSGYGNLDPEIDPEGYNLVDPLHVNTIAVPKNGWVTIRFIANNPVRPTTDYRWAMFGFAVGMLTEYATGSDFVDQFSI